MSIPDALETCDLCDGNGFRLDEFGDTIDCDHNTPDDFTGSTTDDR